MHPLMAYSEVQVMNVPRTRLREPFKSEYGFFAHRQEQVLSRVDPISVALVLTVKYGAYFQAYVDRMGLTLR